MEHHRPELWRMFAHARLGTVSVEFLLEGVAEAAELMEGRGNLGKIVLTV